MKFVYYNNESKFIVRSGIYEIVNLKSGKRYIGSAKKIAKRWKVHAFSLKNKNHGNQHLQRSFDKHCEIEGNDDFLEFHVVEIMENSSKEERLSREEFWINYAQENNISLFNNRLEPTKEAISRSCNSFNPEKTKKSRSDSFKELWKNPEFIEKMVKVRDEVFSDPQVLKNMSEGQTKSWEDNEERKKAASKRFSARNASMTLEEKKESIERMTKSRTKEVYEKNKKLFREKIKENRMVNEIKDFIGIPQPKSSSYFNAFLLSPTNVLYKDIKNLSQFAKEISNNDPDCEALRQVITGQKPTYKDWIRYVPEEYVASSDLKVELYCPLKIYGDLISPDGIIYKDVVSLFKFSKKHNLPKSKLQSLFSGRLKQHKGWKVYISPENQETLKA